MKTKIIAAAAAFALALTSASAFASGFSFTEKNCPNILAGGGTYTSADVQRCH